jgi:hypothetical protein
VADPADQTSIPDEDEGSGSGAGVGPLSAYMTTRDIAAYLGVKPSTVTAYVARGQFIPPAATIWRNEAMETLRRGSLGSAAPAQGQAALI